MQIRILTAAVAVFASSLWSAPASAAPQVAPSAAPLPDHFPALEAVGYDWVDGGLWAIGRDWKARFSEDGLRFVPFLGSDAPTNQPVEMRLRGASIGERSLHLSPRARVSRDGDTIDLDRGDVIVRYHLGLDSIEQTFVLADLPVQPEGDLEVQVETHSELTLEDDAQGMRFRGARGGVRYGAATVLDGAGRALGVPSSREGDQISIRVPRSFLSTAVHPVVVDPVLSTWTVNDDNPVQMDPGDVAFDPLTERYLYAFTRRWSEEDQDVITYFGDRDGNLYGGYYLHISERTYAYIAVSSDASSGAFLVVAETEYEEPTDRNVLGRLRFINGTISPVLPIAEDPDISYQFPSVGGDAEADLHGGFLVFWRAKEQDQQTWLEYRRIQADGTMEPVVELANEVGNPDYHGQLYVSRSNGRGLPSQRLWNLVWVKTEMPGHLHDIWGAQIDIDGQIATAPFAVDSTPERHLWPVVAPPLDAPSGGPRDFLAIYGQTSGSHSHDIRGRLFKGSTFKASYDLTALEAEAAGGDTSWVEQNQQHPRIAVDGSQIALVYCEQEVDDWADDLCLSSWRLLGSQLIPTEPRVELDVSEDHTKDVRIVSEHESGDFGSLRVMGVFARDAAEGGDVLEGFEYQLASGYEPLGTVACVGQPNSMGHSATFRAYGSSDPTDNRLWLDVDNLPSWKSGLFLMSQTHHVTPFGEGFLCLGGQIVRLNSTAGNSWFSGMSGAQVDLSSSPAAAIQAGQTWFFQYWYRDLGGQFNFSNALEIPFE